MNKKDLSERDICSKFISPALQGAGWDPMLQIREEVSFTKGRIIVRGKLVTRGKAKRADYILYYKPNIPIAIIEAKDNGHSVGDGTVGYRVFVCDSMAFHGDFTPVLAKHSKHFNLQDALAIGIDRMQRNFAPMQKQVESWRQFQLTDAAAKLIIYHAFIEDALEAPKHLARHVNDLYFEPQHDEFRERTFWSLSNAFTSAFKELDPIPQFKATAKLGEFLTTVRS